MRTHAKPQFRTGHDRVASLGATTAEELIAQARELGFDSPAYLTLREHLWEYAMPVLMDALRLGKIPSMLLDRSIFQYISDSDAVALHTSSESRDELAVDIITAGEQHLKTVVVKDKWIPEQGASIETFFVTGCLFQFPGVYRKWSRERTDLHTTLVSSDVFAPISSNSDTAGSAVDREFARTVLRQADPTTQAILSLLAIGYTHAEVGQKVGLSERAVEGRIYRFKQLIRGRSIDSPTRRRKQRAA